MAYFFKDTGIIKQFFLVLVLRRDTIKQMGVSVFYGSLVN